MRLYFENSYGKRKFISHVNSLKETYALIDDILEEYHYKSYYIRLWYEKDKKELWIDVGSHSEFFIITEVEENSNIIKNLEDNKNG